MMDLFEYQGKQYFARYDIPTLDGGVADTVDEAVDHADNIGYPVVIKAQVQVGGRGKAGGIKVANTTEEARQHATNILGMDIRGHVVHRLWVEKALPIDKEYYASFTFDRSAKQHLMLLSARGGMDIEQVAVDEPEALIREHIAPGTTPDDAFFRDAVERSNIDEAARTQVVDILGKLYRCYVEGDADLVEINPLILGTDGKVYALDAKVSLDDSAGYRQESWNAFKGTQVLDEREKLAKEKGLQYVGLDGSVGIIANGAGLAMSTLDVVNQVGGSPANFLDIGGGANAQVVANALNVITTDPNVRAIFINIFGGVTRGDEVANGILQALDMVNIDVPIVIRLDGTNATEGRAILQGKLSDKLMMAPTMVDAARKAVALAERN